MRQKRIWIAGLVAAALALGLSLPAWGAECGEDVKKTRGLMQSKDAEKKTEEKKEVEAAWAQAQRDAQGQGPSLEKSTQGNQPNESWQGGSAAQEKMSDQPKRPPYNPTAAKWLKTAAKLDEAGKTGGCRQVLVQAQRILGLIPADTPLPETPQAAAR